jgi:excisionase family DNA binding protein
MATANTQAAPRLLYPVPEVARQLSVGNTYVWELIRGKKLPAVRLGRRVLVPHTALEEFIANQPGADYGNEG